MRALNLTFLLTFTACTAVTTAPRTETQSIIQDEFGYVALPPELLQTTTRPVQLQIPEVVVSESMPPLVKTRRRALKTVEEPESPEFIEERKRKKIPSRFVLYEGRDPYELVESGPEPMSAHALSLAQRGGFEVSRELEPVDGSSFVRKVLYLAHVGMLPRGAEKQERALANSSHFEIVDLAQMQPGDIVFWKGLNTAANPDAPSHAGIYVGDKTVVAQWPGRGILKLRLEGILGLPNIAAAYRFRTMEEPYSSNSVAPSSPKKPIQDLR